MGKLYTPQPIASEVNFKNTVNNNFDDIETALDKCLSRDGETPNQMNADIDLNDNDLLNVKRIDAAEYYQNGQPLDFDSQLQEAKDYADAQDVITLAAANAYTDSELGDFLPRTAELVIDSTTSRTLTASDAGKVLWFSNGSAVTVTLPQTSTEALPNGFQCVIIQGGAGTVTVQAEGAEGIVSFGSLVDTAGQGAAISVIRQGSGVWWVGGNLA